MDAADSWDRTRLACILNRIVSKSRRDAYGPRNACAVLTNHTLVACRHDFGLQLGYVVCLRSNKAAPDE
ncbi:hypothetical protein GCM10007874_43840 [Labrys miyagiensis]|uniref:Uncharacterized protein n=1 Tax=Labrys miyagiensis TaxID=346912 RepID=A0ABQ6CP44_9HYPH|nr:hypothetical protein GCM10007874_43840 [Labrys miyagiensis]